MASRYDPKTDKTLTTAQRKIGGFYDIKKGSTAKGAFRVASNPTARGYSSGYHEAALTTDSHDWLQKRTPTGPGVSAFPASAPTPLRGKRIREANVASTIAAGDGSRTDTAQTVMAVPRAFGGGPAGHSGSGVSQTHQAHAHDLLRETTAAILADSRMTPGGVAVTSAALTVATMAPGEVASKAVNIKALKAKEVASSWEARREEAKIRTEALHAQLSSTERKVVREHVDAFFGKLPADRKLGSDGVTSPARKRQKVGNNFTSGGGYEKRPLSPALLLPPKRVESAKFSSEEARQATLYASQPFRTPRS